MRPTTRLRFTFLFAALPFIAGCSSAISGSIQPGEEFQTKYVSAYAPPGGDWQAQPAGPGALLFVQTIRGARGLGSTAAVSLFRIGEGTSASQFEAFVKASLKAERSLTRFSSATGYEEVDVSRGYPCFRHHGSALDQGPDGAKFDMPMKLMVEGLYCQHPVVAGLAFSATYSARRLPTDVTADISREAAQFLAGVRANDLELE